MALALFGIAGLGYTGLCGLVYLKQDSLLFFPSSVIPADPGELGLTFEAFEIPSRDSSVTGWLVRTDTPGAPWVMQCHGNGGNIANNIPYLALFKKLGFNGVVFDYRGYGRSRGVPSEAGLVEDAMAVRNYLLDKQGVKPEKLVYFGESLGGGVACALAEKAPPAGLVMKSTFTSVPARGAEVYPFLPIRWLARTRFDSDQRIARIDCPKLFMHAHADDVVPYHHGRKLFELAGQPKTWIDIPGGHSTNPLELGREFDETVSDFVRKATAPKAEAAANPARRTAP